VAPLVYEARNWQHGVYVGATMVSETTAAATGQVGIPRNDPMAMLPFCGYNMGDYFAHWLTFQRRLARPPRVFHVNWFRTDEDGRFLWPGFGDNIRVLKWILERVDGGPSAIQTPIGHIPRQDALDLSGLDISPERVSKLLAVDAAAWRDEAKRSIEFLGTFGPRLPPALIAEHRSLVDRIHESLH
jgi:phosphoenolpyruvate carboxykinase (GTP)